jgi:MscS family membrane protein
MASQRHRTYKCRTALTWLAALAVLSRGGRGGALDAVGFAQTALAGIIGDMKCRMAIFSLVVLVFGGLDGALLAETADPPKTTAATPETSKSPESPISQDVFSVFERLQLGRVWQENSAWQWGVLLGAIFLGMVVGKIVGMVLGRLARQAGDRGWVVRQNVLQDLIGPAALALLALGLALGLASLNMSVPLQRFWMKILLLLYSIAFFWYAYNLVSVIEVMLLRLTARTESALDDQLVPLIRKTLRVFLVVIAVMFIFDAVLGQDITAWLAGLGIAGLAVSLAAQDSLKNLFGSITVLLDRPFQLGERIVFGGYDGVVEDIGFRSTKIRTPTGHLVTIPNSKIVNDPVENIGRRPFIRRTIDVTITYDTPREKIEQAVDILRDLLEEKGIAEPIHPTLNGNEYPPRVYFNDYNSESLNIKVLYWFTPPAYWDFMEHGQRLNLRIFEEFEKAGIEFAFPTQTLYLAGDPKRKLAVKMLGKDM